VADFYFVNTMTLADLEQRFDATKKCKYISSTALDNLITSYMR